MDEQSSEKEYIISFHADYITTSTNSVEIDSIGTFRVYKIKKSELKLLLEKEKYRTDDLLIGKIK